MIRLILKTCLALIILNSAVMADNISSLVADENKENVWVVDYITDQSIHASVNGKITHGDRFQVRFVKGNCDIGNVLTSVYTTVKNSNISNLENQYVTSEFMGQTTIGQILFTSPFLLGHISTIDFGWIPKNDLKKILLRENPIILKFVHSEHINITEYFDITENNWVNVGLEDALDRASSMCETL